jgi:hypothetical protein
MICYIGTGYIEVRARNDRACLPCVSRNGGACERHRQRYDDKKYRRISSHTNHIPLCEAGTTLVKVFVVGKNVIR